jgi:hypothetical protein
MIFECDRIKVHNDLSVDPKFPSRRVFSAKPENGKNTYTTIKWHYPHVFEISQTAKTGEVYTKLVGLTNVEDVVLSDGQDFVSFEEQIWSTLRELRMGIERLQTNFDRLTAEPTPRSRRPRRSTKNEATAAPATDGNDEQ